MSDSEDDVGWQYVSAKRPHTNNISESSNKKLKADNKTISTCSNRFSPLVIEETTTINDETAKKPQKPPPIYIPGVSNITKMITNFSKVIPHNDFTYKSTKNDEIRVMVNTIDGYRALVKHLNETNISHHTYQLKQNRSFRFAIKGLHYSTDITSIKAELIILGHMVRNVVNVRSRVTKQPLSLFFVDIDPDESNKSVYNIDRMLNAIVTVEPIKKHDNDFVQCYRCQEYGHTKSYCKKAYRCVKCGLNHPTAECPNKKDVPPQCVHCLQPHTANYKGCLVYQELIKNKTINTNNRERSNRLNMNQPTHTHMPTSNDNYSYASVLKNNVNNNNNDLLTKIEQMINNQTNFMNSVMQMMQTILNKLCK